MVAAFYDSHNNGTSISTLQKHLTALEASAVKTIDILLSSDSFKRFEEFMKNNEKTNSATIPLPSATERDAQENSKAIDMRSKRRRVCDEEASRAPTEMESDALSPSPNTRQIDGTRNEISHRMQTSPRSSPLSFSSDPSSSSSASQPLPGGGDGRKRADNKLCDASVMLHTLSDSMIMERNNRMWVKKQAELQEKKRMDEDELNPARRGEEETHSSPSPKYEHKQPTSLHPIEEGAKAENAKRKHSNHSTDVSNSTRTKNSNSGGSGNDDDEMLTCPSFDEDEVAALLGH